MNKKNYNDYDFIKEHPTLNVKRFENYNVPLDLNKDVAMIQHKFAIQIGDAYDEQFVDTIKEYIEKNNINSATIIDEKSLLDTLVKASKYEAIEKALNLIKQKRDNAQLQLDFEKVDVVRRDELVGQILTYTDCIITIETEMGRK